MSKQKQNGEKLKTILNLLESKDGKVRKKARKSLVAIGKPAVPYLSGILVNSKVYKARWEAAKALGAIVDVKAIPSLVKALEDTESDVAWLAAEALEKYKKAAWPELLNALIERGADSITLRHGAHHVLRKQQKKGFNDLLKTLRKALESNAVPVNTPIAASNILNKLTEHSMNLNNK